jgi:sigma-B regulation protein RsbU (phosphoserine phosphatase)
LADSAEEVAKGNFEAPLPTIAYKDEICELRDSFATMQQSLMTYMENLKEKTAKEAAINNELEVAHKLQMSMIPQKFPAFPKRTDIDLYGSQTPAKSIGGDLFDFFIRNEQLFFCIGDVSGKGIPAALVMTVIHHLFRIVSNREDDPKRIVEIMNESYAADNKSVTFCTFFLGVLDLKTRLLRYCNAGHEAPYLITGAEMEKIKVAPNLPLGLVETKKYEAGELQLEKDAVILLYTDGLTDATNKAEERFDFTRVESTLQSIGKDNPANAADYVNRLLDEVAAYVKGAPQADDLTLLAIKIK